MTMTARAAAELISVSHHLGLRDAGRVLAAGLAGPATRRGSASLYDEDQVHQLINRPQCSLDDLDRWRPFVVRIGRGEPFDALAPWADRVQAVEGPWHLPLATSIALTDWSSLDPGDVTPGTRRMRHPLVGVLADWVTVGAEITGHSGGTFRLAPPGPWFGAFLDTWLPLPPRRRCVLWSSAASLMHASTRRIREQHPGSWIHSVSDPEADPWPARTARAEAIAAYQASIATNSTGTVPVRSNGRL